MIDFLIDHMRDIHMKDPKLFMQAREWHIDVEILIYQSRRYYRSNHNDYSIWRLEISPAKDIEIRSYDI